MQQAGTHKELNDKLLQITASQRDDLYAAALYIIDEAAGYTAPIASVNFTPHADVATYQDNYHRTKLPPTMAQATRAAFAKDYSPARSAAFAGHIVQNMAIGNAPIMLQTVTMDTNYVARPLDPALESDVKRAIERIDTYRGKNGLSWEGVFGLKNPNQDSWVCISDVNGFSKATKDERRFIEAKLPQLARGLAELSDMELFQIIGDEVRVRTDDKAAAKTIKQYAQSLSSAFEQATQREFGHALTLKTAAGRGLLTESFNGDHDNLKATKAYSGEILTEITATLHGMPRHKSSLKLV